MPKLIDESKLIEDALCNHFGKPVTITSKHSVSGGCINQAWKLDLSTGQAVFMKENSARYKDMFHAEATGLRALRVSGGPQVPEPFAVVDDSHSQVILMSYIAEGTRHPRYWEEFGRAFATLHQHYGSDFGFTGDNYIGSTKQINTPSSDWPEFFGTCRLGFQIALAARQELASPSLVQNTEKLISRLPQFLPDDAMPSVLHGDLWGGNAMTGENGSAVIIDPATYWGHFEADLAMTELFGSFPSAFYAAYHEVTPISREYVERKDIYNLYHVLNHLNMFGASYASQANAIINRFI